jgi:hypothetical protein
MEMVGQDYVEINTVASRRDHLTVVHDDGANGKVALPGREAPLVQRGAHVTLVLGPFAGRQLGFKRCSRHRPPL